MGSAIKIQEIVAQINEEKRLKNSKIYHRDVFYRGLWSVGMVRMRYNGNKDVTESKLKHSNRTSWTYFSSFPTAK